MVEGIDLDLASKPDFCDVCVKAKAACKPFPKMSLYEAKAYGEKVVSDIWGPAPVTSLGGKDYSLCFLDLYSHEERIYFLKHKSEAFEIYKVYEAWVRVQRNAVIKILGTDRAGEFTSKAFRDHTDHAGTVRHLTVHDSPQSNGASERSNRTHAECARAMLIASGLPKFLWAEAWLHSVWLRNRAPTRALREKKTPFEMGTGTKPDLSDLREWGCTAWVKRMDANKLEPKAEECHFVGYDAESKAYRVYWPGRRKVSVERDVYFNRDETLSPEIVQIEGEWDAPAASSPASPATTSALNNPDPPAELDEPDSREDLDQPNEPQNQDTHPVDLPPRRRHAIYDDLPEPEPNTGRGFRERKPAGYYHVLSGKKTANVAALMEDMDQEIGLDGIEEDLIDFALLTRAGPGEPETIDEAMRMDDAQKWLDAVETELTQVEGFKTWDIVEAPPDANITKSRYVFRLKRNPEGQVVKHKARLVAKGFTQVYGLDYFDTFAPTVKHSTLRTLLSFAAQRDSAIHQADVKNAYLNADLKEDIYMALPPHYTRFRTLPSTRPSAKLVCKLKKAIYGTKQGANKWYQKVKTTFEELQYTMSMADEAVFYKVEGDGYTIVAAATDDFTIIADSDERANRIKEQLNEYFELVDLGEISWLLGIHLIRDRTARTISLGQQAYIDRILIRMKLEDARSVTTPMEPGIDLSYDSPAVSAEILTDSEKSKYREAIGSLMYAAIGSRPDIAYAVSTLSRFMESPRTTHWKAVQRVFKYLKGTRDLRLFLGGRHSTLKGYSDADWASQMDRHSISGYAFFVGDGCHQQIPVWLIVTYCDLVDLFKLKI
jgi:Reverse transcriptase (RNA-dependent DNA polymerase)